MSKQAKVIIISVISVFLLAVFGLILVEQLGKNKITVSNHTDKRIESLDLFFETEDEGTELMKLYNEALEPGQEYKSTFETINFGNDYGDIGMLVKFEGVDSIYVYGGLFENSFDGKINIEFYQAEGQYRVSMSATTGLFNSDEKTSLKKDDIYFMFDEADWEYVGSDGEDGIEWEFEDEDDEEDEEEDDEADQGSEE